ncbi:hypothetical protein MTO96_019811 [Rhipicephalus appendiculatus]
MTVDDARAISPRKRRIARVARQRFERGSPHLRCSSSSPHTPLPCERRVAPHSSERAGGRARTRPASSSGACRAMPGPVDDDEQSSPQGPEKPSSPTVPKKRGV